MKLSELDAFTVKVHGDGRERALASSNPGLWQGYEAFWRRHIVPLTFRIVDKSNYYVRPTLNDVLHELANASYDCMFHFAGAMNAGQELLRASKEGSREGADALYVYFCHMGSLRDGLSRFASVVNGVLEEYGEARTFDIMTRHGSFLGGDISGPTPVAAAYNDFSDEVSWMRNQLVHNLVVHPLRPRVARRVNPHEICGLEYLAKLALDEGSSHAHFITFKEFLGPKTARARIAATTIWHIASKRLDELQERPSSGYWASQTTVAPRDRELTRERIESGRGLTN